MPTKIEIEITNRIKDNLSLFTGRTWVARLLDGSRAR
jgi:hypothetical protein